MQKTLNDIIDDLLKPYDGLIQYEYIDDHWAIVCSCTIGKCDDCLMCVPARLNSKNELVGVKYEQ